MRKQLRFSGVGGQGVLLAGEILAEAKMCNGGYAIKAASYTSQVRGGPTKVDILLDEEPIFYPYATEGSIDFMLSTAQVSYNQFKTGIKKGGIIVVDSNLVTPSQEDKSHFKIIEIPIISIAKNEIGNVVTQSVVALGVSVELSNAIERDVVFEVMKSKVPKKVLDLNIKAFEIGEQYARQFL
ncbi:2-oxoglutarate:acceptor oxidoreductase [Helicobacter enhydrae]|uniref:2-oxoglutarate:acceptor oxidoreductase n=1 Tax=Helicobacter enhydrae TaxID=222136 RepID=A0A1B1U4S2_9HELI|nr:2-oxoacid:acceptor oxidoreductase family protein [Helicobacter enhydrae]ANV97749.1 2-oxoglutarate:acceptor oxidoreductase [Helicobacter enhydrae]